MQTKAKILKFSHTIIIFLAICLVFIFLNISYANMQHDEPNVLVSIDSNGNCTTQGNLFGNELLYPGKQITGTIRITSESAATISNLSLNINIDNYKKKYLKETVYDSFTSNLFLSAKKGFIIFNDIIFEDIALSCFTSNEGYALKESNQITIVPGKSTELLYTLSMSEEAGDELEGIISSISYVFRTESTVIE